MTLDAGEKQFYRIILLNKLVSQETLDLIVKEIEVSGDSLPSELRSRNTIRSDLIDKIIKGIEAHGEVFTKPLIKQKTKGVVTKALVPDHVEHVIGLDAPSEPMTIHKIVAKQDLDIEFELETNNTDPPVVSSKKPVATIVAKSPEIPPPPVEVKVEIKEKEEEGSSRIKIEGPGLLPNTSTEPKGLGKKLIQYLNYARKEGASDFHITPTTSPFLRKYSQIIKLEEPPVTAEDAQAMLFGILSEAQLTKIKVDLGLDFCLIAPDNLRYRANIVQGSNGWSGTFRVINEHPPSFESLGLPNVAKRLTEYHQGLVLVTGSKGCGKTTTLASMIDLINTNRKEHIITVEDPIEYIHPSKLCQITQRALGINTMSYANALRGALREDPDIIMVGELRDLDTIKASISAAETGHLVLGSLHTTSAIRTIDRIIDAFPAKQQGQIRVMIAESIRGVICQQLLPRADGNGTVLALEVLLNNISVRKNIIEGKTFMLDNIMQTSVREGMIRMDDSIYQLWQQGLITEATAREFAREPNKLGKSMDI